jgi:hypothetical protein
MIVGKSFNPDYPLGREMMARRVTRQFCHLRGVHGYSMDDEQGANNGRKPAASARAGAKRRLMDNLGLNHEFTRMTTNNREIIRILAATRTPSGCLTKLLRGALPFSG